MEDLAAEIEYIKVQGIQYAQKECRKCHMGVPNFDQSRCQPCLQNQYLDDLAAEGGECENCPAGTYSAPGAYGISDCIKREPCTEDDYTFSYSECDFENNERTLKYFWKVPHICEPDESIGSVSLP